MLGTACGRIGWPSDAALAGRVAGAHRLQTLNVIMRPTDSLDAKAIKQEAGYRARRWVVERTHSWMNRFRRILVRWEKRVDTYLAMLHLACGLICWRAANLLR